MPTKIELSYVERCSQFAENLGWEMVAERCSGWVIADLYVPIALAPGCVGLPRIDIVPLRHP